jgi:hypothetical protein
MTLYDASLSHTDELVQEIQKIKEESANAMRRTRRERWRWRRSIEGQ